MKLTEAEIIRILERMSRIHNRRITECAKTKHMYHRGQCMFCSEKQPVEHPAR